MAALLLLLGALVVFFFGCVTRPVETWGVGVFLRCMSCLAPIWALGVPSEWTGVKLGLRVQEGTEAASLVPGSLEKVQSVSTYLRTGTGCAERCTPPGTF